MRILSLIACLLLFGGCSVQSSQLSSLMGVFRTPDGGTISK